MCLYQLLLILLSLQINSVFNVQIMEKLTDDLILEPGENYTLTCEGMGPITWKYPSDVEHYWTDLTVVNEDNFNRSLLHITNMSYPFVGYYTCTCYDEEDSIYLYVNDTENLSVKDAYPFVYVVQYHEVIIPCRPTSPDVKVTLEKTEPENSVINFNPRKGFLLSLMKTKGEFPRNCIFTRETTQTKRNLLIIVEPEAPSLATPFIEDLSKNHTEVGDDLILACYVQTTLFCTIKFHWKTPRGEFVSGSYHQDKNVTISFSGSRNILNQSHCYTSITIAKSTLKDSGKYTCEVHDRQEHNASASANIVVYNKEECSVSIYEDNGQTTVNATAGNSIKMILNVVGHPPPKLQWYNNRNEEIIGNSEVRTSHYDDTKAMLTIKKVQLENAGTYKLVATSERSSTCSKFAEYEFELNVAEKPTISFIKTNDRYISSGAKSRAYFLANEMVQLRGEAKGNPLPEISCVSRSEAGDSIEQLLIENCLEESIPSKKYIISFCIRLDATADGEVTCSATNTLGSNDVTFPYYISDIENGFDLKDFNHGAVVNRTNDKTAVAVAENDLFSFSCAVANTKVEEMAIFFNDKPLIKQIHGERSKYSTKLQVNLNNTQFENSGSYSCRIRNNENHFYEYRNLTLIVKAPARAQIWKSNMEKVVTVAYPKMRFELTCFVNGLPKPHITWYKDGHILETTNRVILQNDKQILLFSNTEVEDEGYYRCEVFNSVNSVSKVAKLTFRVKEVSLIPYLAPTGFISILLIIALIYIIMKRRKEQELRRRLKALGLENFENGDPSSINPDLGIDDQADLLPYNKKFEFPIEHLKLGKQLGSGAFGVVMKAEAKGLVPGDLVSTVAVKMVKKNADDVYIKALASELKVMVHLGKHVNVVNLLGACTKNVANKELYVIVEYCRFGNLQRYIFQHRETYINQVDKSTGKINYNVGADVLNRSYSVTSDSNSRTYSVSTQDYSENPHTMTTQLSYTGDDTVILSNSSSQPEWRLNYKGDYKGEVQPICTKDLLIWSFQVARGMEYLASRKVLHGDLAARNILLAENNVVKICDFGLAKSMYNDNNYKKKGNAPLPIKWMAIESIRDRVFSTESDVWSFGIVLWEFFSLARTPYPGMEPDEHFYNKLVQGYRMEPPEYSPHEINTLMNHCWNVKPLARPSFTRLAEVIGNLLETALRRYYIDLNDPYLRVNTENLEEDYLAMVSSPTFAALTTPPPSYENSQIIAFHLQQNSKPVPEGYMEMKPANIFSPRILPNGKVFSFPQAGLTSFRKASTDEELESNTGYLEPITPINSVSNPLYNQLQSTAADGSSKLIQTADNYISMPHYKNVLRKNSKPSKLPSDVTNENEEHSQVLMCE